MYCVMGMLVKNFPFQVFKSSALSHGARANLYYGSGAPICLLGVRKSGQQHLYKAAQTAERFVTAADLTQRIEWLDDLTPQGDLGVIEEFLQNTAVETILMVSHLPLVEILIDLLIGESEACMGTGNPTSVSMPCAGRGTAQLNWIQHANGIY